MSDIVETNNEPKEDDNLIQKPKKREQSEKQKLNTIKMIEGRKKKAQDQLDMKAKIEEQDKIIKRLAEEKLTEKIKNKVTNLNRKRVSVTKAAKELLDNIDIDSEESDKEIEIKPKIKIKEVKPIPEKKVENIKVSFENIMKTKYKYI
jgi:hypothetical protein